ncbi:hydrogenase small subunit [Clostridium cylindrosporum]|uniref:Periplasmic [NiFe] hydrogenase small subunit HydA n=1 Tax=Clostridium cylindrosporum DSM 605 TaxID=1121307 RepID=A0A0J8D8N3_CLOCY|nr:hydrogenase small subunit [Clostridium cylindrosporum]KMT22242.1 periplasmic [NiFe] hydrogenase small subunit HydA [Clostridium cylindrosporum DSM 605]
MDNDFSCPRLNSNPDGLANAYIKRAINDINLGKVKKPNAIWLETSGCFGQIISLLDAESPDVLYFLKNLVNLTFLGTISGDEGEVAYERVMALMDTDFIFMICGAIPKKDNGLCTRVATYKGKEITAAEITAMLAKKAKHIIAIGTCACYGGPTAARPNVTEAVSIPEFLGRNDVIKLPGCPTNPIWSLGTIGYLVSFGIPQLDSDGRPIAYYGKTIHDLCERRPFFDKGIFAQKLGDSECMFMLGCRGPKTKADCPRVRWNQTEFWPVGVNTTCIGCTGPDFPDKNEPFVHYGGV